MENRICLRADDNEEILFPVSKHQPFHREESGLSGIAGIFHRDGAPIERALLQSFADFLSYRGPDARAIWMDGSMGMAHAMLRTTHESLSERQPATLDGRCWIVADARLDSRAELIADLERSMRAVGLTAPDSELVLHAYAVWGEQCVEQLRGDFSFGIWDAYTKTLFCARDQFGIKPFYYAQAGDFLLFSNILNCARLHPYVSDELNDSAIGDFLLFGLNHDNSTTTFRDVQRLPPAHSLIFSPRSFRIKRYWAPPTDGRIRYAKPEEYVEHFQTLFESAVADRLRTDRAGILLSGGLDSSSVAAVAKAVSAKSEQTTDLRGYTYVYESLIPHEDGAYASEAGEFLRIPIKFFALDQTELFELWNDPKSSLPEPIDNPLFADVLDSRRIISADCRVLLSGEGGDNLMYFQMWPYVEDLRRNGEWRQLVTEMAKYLWIRPFPWRGIRARVLRFAGKDPYREQFPEWLAPEFKQRVNLAARWKEGCKLLEPWMMHLVHPRAYASLSLPQWTLMFEQENAGVTRYPVEMRYPFLDLRVVNYLLALPPFPWFFQKMLVRQAMRGRLPERVRMRPKTPLRRDPVCEQFRRTGVTRLKQVPVSPELDHYIERSRLAAVHDKMNMEEMRSNLRPHCLNIWLQSAQRVRQRIHGEAGDG